MTDGISEYIVCKECQKKIEEETYIKVTGDPLEARIPSDSIYAKHCRQVAIYDSILKLQSNPGWFDNNYIGVKNYSVFGDQREDHEYGRGPKHGSIVFRIEIKDRYKKGNLDDHQRVKAIGYLNSLLKMNIDKHGYGIKL